MNIGFDAKRAFTNFTGLGNYSRSLLLSLTEVAPENTYTLYTTPFKWHTRNLMLAEKGFIIEQPNTAVGKLWPGWWRSRGCAHHINHNGTDLFHGLSHELPEGLSVPSVVTMHDLIFERYPQFYPWIDTQVYRYKFRSAARRATHVVAVSQQTADDLMQFYQVPAKKLSIIYQCADPIFETPATNNAVQAVRAKYQLPPQFILAVGSVIERKNIGCLIQALQYMHADVHLVVVGSGKAHLTKMQALARQRGVSDRIVWLTKTDFVDFPALYKTAHIFAQPSHFEGFGIPVLEAMWSGTPVVASNSTCFEEVGGDAALYLPPDQPQLWAHSVSELLNDPVRCADMSRRGRARARRTPVPVRPARRRWRVRPAPRRGPA
jgi:glycosyltransferase involved in cell wall biosynthesis